MKLVVLRLFVLTTVTLTVRAACPPNVDDDSLYHCLDPEFILLDDTIQCDARTCAWDLQRLDADAAPRICQTIDIVPSQIPNVPDLLEPCLWWQMLYGNREY